MSCIMTLCSVLNLDSLLSRDSDVVNTKYLIIIFYLTLTSFLYTIFIQPSAWPSSNIGKLKQDNIHLNHYWRSKYKDLNETSFLN